MCMLNISKTTTGRNKLKKDMYQSDKIYKKKNTPNNTNTNYRTEMKSVPLNMDYYLLQFDALKFFLGVRLHGGSLPNFNFFNVSLQIF